MGEADAFVCLGRHGPTRAGARGTLGRVPVAAGSWWRIPTRHPMPPGTSSGAPWRTLANSRPATLPGLLSTQPRTWGLDVSGQPNTRLSDLFGLAGWSKGELARLVNRQAAAM